MKRLLNPTGGRPVKNEDLQLFEQFITLLEGLFSEFEDGIIVSGCEITGTSGDYDISSGYIYYDGNICVFDGVEGVSSLPYAMEKTETEGTPRTFFDDVSKNTINTIAISGQVGGGFSMSASTPRLREYVPVVATQAEGRSGTDDTAFMSSLRVLDFIRNGTGSDPTTSLKGTPKIATQTEGRTGTNNLAYMTSLRVLDFIRNGTGVGADTSNKGTVEKATAAEFIAATADKYPDSQIVWQALGYTSWQTPTLNSGFTHGPQSLQYRFYGTLLQIRGSVNATVASGTLFTLPSAYRPISLTIGIYSSGGLSTVSFGVTDAGAVIVSGMSTSASNLFNSTLILD